MNFKNKKIILGITGSIAAYKTPLLAREFIKLGAEIRIVATQAAKEFVSLMVLENLTRNFVITDMFDKRMQGNGAWHVELAHWCDAMLIAPCSATTLAKIATGNCDNPLSCVAIALPKEKPLILAPAMDFTMYEHPATQQNILTVRNFGAKIIYPDEGELASGLLGKGRLPEFETLLVTVNEILNGSNLNEFNISSNSNISLAFEKKTAKNPNLLTKKDDSNKKKLTVNSKNHNVELEKPLEILTVENKVEQIFKNKKILITAGATQEKIDDVRFISNYSTGKMGYSLAKVANSFGAEVTLISGKAEIPQPEVSNFVQIISAEGMFEAVQNHYKNQDIIIMAAAVADFTPLEKFVGKIKKQILSDNYSIQLKKTIDILKWIGERRKKQFIVGFALETENEIENGRKKLEEKCCDMLVINSASKANSGFGGDSNTISILLKDGNLQHFETMTKERCAEEILLAIHKRMISL